MGAQPTSPVGTVTNFPGSGIRSPEGIASGPDGNLWFTNVANSSIGRITPEGEIANFTGEGIERPTGITAGPDGNLWFTNNGNSSIGRITPDGEVDNFTGDGITILSRPTRAPTRSGIEI